MASGHCAFAMSSRLETTTTNRTTYDQTSCVPHLHWCTRTPCFEHSLFFLASPSNPKIIFQVGKALLFLAHLEEWLLLAEARPARQFCQVANHSLSLTKHRLPVSTFSFTLYQNRNPEAKKKNVLTEVHLQHASSLIVSSHTHLHVASNLGVRYV